MDKVVGNALLNWSQEPMSFVSRKNAGNGASGTEQERWFGKEHEKNREPGTRKSPLCGQWNWNGGGRTWVWCSLAPWPN